MSPKVLKVIGKAKGNAKINAKAKDKATAKAKVQAKVNANANNKDITNWDKVYTLCSTMTKAANNAAKGWEKGRL